jgi:hypothetical protein
LQGKNTREQQLRTFERKPDVPDARQIEEEMADAPEQAGDKPQKNRA